MLCSSHASSHPFLIRMPPSIPYDGVLWSSKGIHSMSGWESSRNVSVSLSNAARNLRTISIFACDRLLPPHGFAGVIPREESLQRHDLASSKHEPQGELLV